MNILFDDNMPFGQQLFPLLGEAYCVDHLTLNTMAQNNDRELAKTPDLSTVDAFMCRSTTRVNAALLSHFPQLNYVATATAGTNHFDYAALEQHNVSAYHAAGCNADAVAQYALSAVLYYLMHHPDVLGDLACVNDLGGLTIGVIGAGQVGSRVIRQFEALGATVRAYDPIRAVDESRPEFNQLEDVLQSNIICCHAPLTVATDYPSYHLLNASRLAQLKTDQLLLNAGRGEVIDTQALFTLKAAGTGPRLILDVWENEPDIDMRLVEHCIIATPHIAGHTLEGKARGTFMCFNWLAQQVGSHLRCNVEDYLPVQSQQTKLSTPTLTLHDIYMMVLQVYDIEQDHSDFIKVMAQSSQFSWLRKSYRNPAFTKANNALAICTQSRREFYTFEVLCMNQEQVALLNALGFSSRILR